MPLEILVQDEKDWRIIAVVGEVDLNSSPELRKAVIAGIKDHGQVGVDLSQASYMDSSGVATMVEGLKAAGAKEQTFALLRPSGPVMKVLQLARLDALFDIREDWGT